MAFSETSPDVLAEQVISCFNKDVNYVPIPTDGAQRAAAMIKQLLDQFVE